MTVSKKEAQELIEKLSFSLADHLPVTGASNTGRENVADPYRRYPVLIGDVLFHAKMTICWDADERKEWRNDLIDLWMEFENMSLQEIFQEWEDYLQGSPPKGCVGTRMTTRLKDPHARALASFLIDKIL